MSDEIEDMIHRLKIESGWKSVEEALLAKRLRWFDENKEWIIEKLNGSPVERAYQLMLLKLEISEKEAYIIEKTPNRITLHSKNFCPVIGACDYTYVELVADAAATTWSAGDFMMDDLKLISSGDYTKTFEST